MAAAAAGDVAAVSSMLGIDDVTPSGDGSQAAPRLNEEEQWVRARTRLVNGRADDENLWTPMMAAACHGQVSR